MATTTRTQAEATEAARKGAITVEAAAATVAGADPQAVTQNRALLQMQLGGARPVFLSQVHGVEVAQLNAATRDGTKADACLTQAPRVACTIMAADCLPILVCHPRAKWVAGAHAGWRGLAGTRGHGVVETLAQAALLAGLHPQDCLVWLGPCIGPTAFEVGADVHAAFENVLQTSDKPANLFVPTSSTKYLADLAGLARERLKLAGFKAIYGNDSSLPWCTYRQDTTYHSHRRDAVAKGGSGRMAAYIWLRPD